MADNVEVYGSARLRRDGTFETKQFFFPDGVDAMPLGWNAGDEQKGWCYAPSLTHPGHALTFGRTRGGKGVSSIIPALLTYWNSMVVIDPKGENAWITAERRRALGNRVVILDPWGEVNRRYGSKAGVTETVTQFNPLSALDPSDDNFNDDVAAIAEAFILQTGNDPHWSESARELVAGLIATEVQRNPQAPSMRSVRECLRAPLLTLQAVVTNTIEDFPDSVGAAKLAAIIDRDDDGSITNDRELASIRSTARTQTAFLDSKALLDSMETDVEPFNLADLATERVTLFLVLPVDRLATHGRWLRMILTLAIRAVARAKHIPKPPILFMLDELGTISPGHGLPMIEQSVGLMAGLGIRIWAFLQDLPQLKRDYPHSWETFISNSSVIQLLNVADNTTAKYFSEFLGHATINAKTGQWLLRQSQYGSEDADYMTQWIEEAVRIGRDNGLYRSDPVTLRTEIVHYFDTNKGAPWARGCVETAKRSLQDRGITQQAISKWTEETQPMSRPVLYPQEIIGAPRNSCILINPNLDNFLLRRYVYYEHPLMSKWARPDPNRISGGT